MRSYRAFLLFSCALIGLAASWHCASRDSFRFVRIPRETLGDKIKGGWAGQVIGCTYGGPTEFRFRSTFIPDHQPIEWAEDRILWYYENAPGLYDDIYMDLTFVEVFAMEGLDAPAEHFARAFANARYPLWHANQAARYNILQGIPPPQSGHWLNNPHADDIDFQIEADFAGLMSPGMTGEAAAVCDTVGHIMNYGDGWYGGVYMAAMYALAFITDDIGRIVEQALRVIPEESLYHQCMRDVIRWHRAHPRSWKTTWFHVQEKWGRDVGCPDGVFTPFNIDAKINSAWVLLGLLYGGGDFGKTLSIATRCGDDSDCNPASAGGILGTMLGYSGIPDEWKKGLDAVEDRDFLYTRMSLNDAYALSLKHALAVIERSGGTVTEHEVSIPVRAPAAVRLEAGFEGHVPIARIRLREILLKESRFDFTGVGFALTGEVTSLDGGDHITEVEMIIDGGPAELIRLPTNSLIRKNTPFWKYRLPQGEHSVLLRVLDPGIGAEIRLHDLIVYGDAPYLRR